MRACDISTSGRPDAASASERGSMAASCGTYAYRRTTPATAAGVSCSSRSASDSGSRKRIVCGCWRNSASSWSRRARGEPNCLLQAASAAQRAKCASSAASRLRAWSAPSASSGRHHAVEHNRASAVRVSPQVLERHARAVRDADEVDLLGTDRGPNRLEVEHRVAGGVEPRVGIQAGEATLGEPTAGRRIAERVLVGARFGLRAGELVRPPGAALVHQHHVALAQDVAEGSGRDRKGLERRLAGTTREHEHRVRPGTLRATGHERQRELDLAARRSRTVLRHREPRAIGGDGGRRARRRQRAGLERQRPKVAVHRTGGGCSAGQQWQEQQQALERGHGTRCGANRGPQP